MEAIDQPWKVANEGRVGAYWGIYSADRNPKFDFAGPVEPDRNWGTKALLASALALLPMFWFLVAARQGDQDAGARAAALQQTLQPIQVEQARARAQAFRPRAASAQANGEFGARPYATPAAASARPGT